MQPSDIPATSDPRLHPFHALYRGEFAFVWAAARRLGVPPGAIEDAVQDVFVIAYRRREQLRFEVSARAWLYGVTRRVASHYHRGVFRRRRRDAALAAEPGPPHEAPQEQLVRTQSVDRLLARLGPGTRAAWEMSELLGMSGPEIASELGLPLNTVYSRVRLARQQLQRELLAPQLERWIAEERERGAPPERAAQRSWALLLPTFGSSGSASAGLGLLTTTRAAVAATLLLVSAVVLVAPQARSPAAASAPTPTTHASPPTLTPTPLPAAAAAAAPDHTPPPVVHRPSRRSRPAADRLAEEVALLDRAQVSLAAGDAAGAQALLAEHARRHPDGALIDLRAAAQVQALCLQGDAPAAALAARQLVLMHPRSAVAQRHKNFICPR